MFARTTRLIIRERRGVADRTFAWLRELPQDGAGAPGVPRRVRRAPERRLDRHDQRELRCGAAVLAARSRLRAGSIGRSPARRAQAGRRVTLCSCSKSGMAVRRPTPRASGGTGVRAPTGRLIRYFRRRRTYRRGGALRWQAPRREPSTLNPILAWFVACGCRRSVLDRSYAAAGGDCSSDSYPVTMGFLCTGGGRRMDFLRAGVHLVQINDLGGASCHDLF